jgi:hypothetical protein
MPFFDVITGASYDVINEELLFSNEEAPEPIDEHPESQQAPTVSIAVRVDATVLFVTVDKNPWTETQEKSVADTGSDEPFFQFKRIPKRRIPLCRRN